MDWLTIETYKNIESYRACGSTIPPPYISSQDHVWIRFHSDDSISRKGFRLAYFSGVFLNKKKDMEQNSIVFTAQSLWDSPSKQCPFNCDSILKAAEIEELEAKGSGAIDPGLQKAFCIILIK